MNKFFTLFAISVFLLSSGFSQSVYNITNSRTWQNNNNAAYPTTCYNCTFNLSPGVTLTIDRNVTLQNCTINGGTIILDNKSVTLWTANNGQTFFNNVKFIGHGNGQITGSAPMIMSNSEFFLDGNFKFNPQQLFELNNTKMHFYGNSYLVTTGGPVNLKNNSYLEAGDGSMDSKAYLYFNGPQLNLYDQSLVVLGNNNNYYFNWSSYMAMATNTSYSTMTNTYNCGSGYPHGCQMPYLYGPSSLTPAGTKNFNSLPVVLSDFSVKAMSNQTVAINWATDQEDNSSYFQVERSQNGTDWTIAGKVSAKGHSTITTQYSLIDWKPVDGINYYRLKMVDLDGTYEYSKVESVQMSVASKVSLFPNPAKDQVTISLQQHSGSVKVRMMNTNGQLLQEALIAPGVNTLRMPLQSITSGTYLVQLINQDGSSVQHKLIVQ